MGGAASIEQAHTLNIDYATLRSSGINFATAYDELDARVRVGHADEMNLHFLAIRQLSQNLRNQDTLERSRRKVLKSRSLPNNLRYKEDGPLQATTEQREEVRDEFDQDDLDIIHDSEYSVSPQFDIIKEKKEATKEKEKGKKKKPVLALQLSETSISHDPEKIPSAPLLGGLEGGKGESFMTRMSPRGTLYMGQLKINEKGIFPDDSAPTSPVKLFAEKRVFLCDTALMNGSFHLRPVESEEISLPALGGKDDFVEIATLGSGASGVVAEAVHVPSLTLVALKMLPVYNQEKRQHVSRELRVLYKNLSEMRLIDETLTAQDDSLSPTSDKQSERCPNVLSLYNAFVDPKSGMINLVIEYMDGGSLEDLVKQGGCGDERVLADIAFQTLNGLSFLHKNKNIHRDIKPANILCSSSGTIKIADFGISKALDHSTGFANSFVGTVCYMSPERINGESYSFSCDIWSLGLTILAVAKGRFPISATLGNGSSSSDADQVIGGPGGYWTMMKAICDDEPPVAGPKFSVNFNAFIASCLCKEPSSRSSAKELLQTSFVTENRRPDAEESCPEKDDDLNVQIQKLTGNAIERSVTSSATNSEANSAREGERSNLDIIYSIRLEHLDRVLQKLVDVLQSAPTVSRTMSEYSFHDDQKCQTPSPIDFFASTPSQDYHKSSFFSETEPEEHFHKSHTNKSVHFELQQLSPPPQHTKSKKKKNLLLNLNLLGDIDDDVTAQDEEPFDATLSLPKTSSYFAATKFDTKPSNEHFIMPKKVDYARLLPRFDKAGFHKWKALAEQLHLPLPIVLIAVRAKLGNIVDLDKSES